MKKFLRTSMVPSIALAGFASLMVSEPAAARRLNACQVKHSYCSERCVMNYDGGAINSCIQRTCNRQHPGCGSESLGGGRRGLVANLKQPGPVASGPQTPRGGNSGPFVPGSVKPKDDRRWGGSGAFAPDRGRGIGSQGMPKNGGIVPSAPTHVSSRKR